MAATVHTLETERRRRFTPVIVAHQDGARFRATGLVHGRHQRHPWAWVASVLLSILVHILAVAITLDISWKSKKPAEPIYVEYVEQGKERKRVNVEPEAPRETTKPSGPQQQQQAQIGPEAGKPVAEPSKPVPPAPRPAPKPELQADASNRARPPQSAPTAPQPEVRRPDPRKLPDDQVNITKVEPEAPPVIQRQMTDIVPPDATPDTYEKILLRHISKFSAYPRAAIAAGMEGRGIVAMTLRRDGALVRSNVIRTSGHKVLDDAMGRILLRADPLPAPPANWGKQYVDIALPFEFALER